MHIRAIKKMVKESPTTTIPDSDDKKFQSIDQNIELYTEVCGNYRTTDIQEDNLYETMQPVH